MSRAVLILEKPTTRAIAQAWVAKAPKGTRLEFKGPRRSLPQNDKLWAALTDIAQQMTWHGRKLTAAKWKLLFMDALNRASDPVPSLDGQGVVDLGSSSSDLSTEECSDLIEIILAWGAEHSVTFSEATQSANERGLERVR